MPLQRSARGKLMTRYLTRSTRPATMRTDRTAEAVAAFLLITLMLTALPARGALVRPLTGHGDFSFDLDMIERPATGGRTDLVLVVSVPNAELAFKEVLGGGMTGRIAVTASLGRGEDAVRRSAELPVMAGTREDAEAYTVQQVFSLVLPGIARDEGPFRCTVTDLEGGRVRRLREGMDEDPASRIEIDWYRDVDRGAAHGLWIGDPLYLSGAPRRELEGPRIDGRSPERGLLGEYLHPNRRYGVEQSRLQVVFDVEAVGLTPASVDHLPKHLLVQVLSREMDFALRDTLELGLDPTEFVASGTTAEISWSYDVNALPPGTYQLSCAPLDGWGNAWITEFDVFWSLQTLARPSEEQFLIGSIVLTGDRRETFMKAGESERAVILARFWDEYDPDPTTPESEALWEFRRRMDHVERFLGGFGRSGPVDDRGLIYLMLGPPDEIQETAIPINEKDFFSAIDRVYDAYVPQVTGEMFRDEFSSGEQTVQAVRQKQDRNTSIEKFKSFALWLYEGNGHSLFPNVYTDMPLGIRFLFLARLGGGVYQLELSNTWDKAVYGQ